MQFDTLPEKKWRERDSNIGASAQPAFMALPRLTELMRQLRQSAEFLRPVFGHAACSYSVARASFLNTHFC